MHNWCSESVPGLMLRELLLLCSCLLLLLRTCSFSGPKYHLSFAGKKEFRGPLRSLTHPLETEYETGLVLPSTDVTRARASLKTCISTLAAVGVVSAYTPLKRAQAYALPECSDEVAVLKGPGGREVVIIGTAHISEDSVTLVRKIVRELQPDTVMIELDPKRLGRVGSEGESLEELGFDIPKQTKLALESGTSTGTAVERSGMLEKKRMGILDGFKDMVRSWVQRTAGAGTLNWRKLFAN